MPDQYESLNEGKGEGCAYRGRVLVELGTTIGELPDKHIADVDNDDLFRLHVNTNTNYGKNCFLENHSKIALKSARLLQIESIKLLRTSFIH